MTRVIPLERYRNIGILGLPDSGRTTTTERLLALAASRDVPAPGVEDREITLTSAATSFEWGGCRLNLIALPPIGYPADAASLQALDAVVVIIDAAAGVTEPVRLALARAAQMGLAALVFVNKVELAPGRTAEIVAAIRGGVALQVPVVNDCGLGALIGVVNMQATVWQGAGFDAASETHPVSNELAPLADAGRATFLAALPAGAADPVDRLRVAVQSGDAVPVLFGSAFFNRGIVRLMNAIIRYLPAPSEVVLHAETADGAMLDRRASDDEPFSGLAFQVLDDPVEGRLTFVRVCSGIVSSGAETLNTVTMSSERVGAMMRIHANHAEMVEEARTGDVVAFTGLQHTSKGDTLCDPAAPVILGGFRPRTAA